MTLGACRECGHQVSHETDVCPSCGVKGPTAAALVRAERGKTIRVWMVLALIVVVAAGGLAYNHHRDQVKRDRQACEFQEAFRADATGSVPDYSQCR